MNYLTAGDSHGKYLIGILAGFPYGLKITKEYISQQLERRRKATGRSKRMEIENDEFEIISGLKNSITTGMPVGIIIKNNKTTDLEKTLYSHFTPAHSELTGMLKYSHYDGSIIKERTSARETVVRVALFSFTKRFLELLDIKITSKVIKCYTEENSENFQKLIDNFKNENDSFGGIFEIKIKNFPPGIGGFTQGNERITVKISKELFAIPSIKGVEFGEGFKITNYKGTEIIEKPELLGGIECGVTDGKDIIIRCATRPIAGINREIKTYDIKTGKKKIISIQTSDITSVFASAIIAEYAISYVLTDEILKQFHSDNFSDIKKDIERWRKNKEKILKKIK